MKNAHAIGHRLWWIAEDEQMIAKSFVVVLVFIMMVSGILFRVTIADSLHWTPRNQRALDILLYICFALGMIGPQFRITFPLFALRQIEPFRLMPDFSRSLRRSLFAIMTISLSIALLFGLVFRSTAPVLAVVYSLIAVGAFGNWSDCPETPLSQPRSLAGKPDALVISLTTITSLAPLLICLIDRKIALWQATLYALVFPLGFALWPLIRRRLGYSRRRDERTRNWRMNLARAFAVCGVFRALSITFRLG